MKTPYEIRFERAMETLRRYAKHTGRPIDQQVIRDLETSIYASNEIAPSTGEFMLYPTRELDFDWFLRYLYAVENDVNFIADALSYLEDVARNLELSIKAEKHALSVTERLGMRYLSLISVLDPNAKGSIKIAIPNDIIPSMSKNIDASTGKIRLSSSDFGLTKSREPVESDLSINVLEAPNMVSFAIIGSRREVLIPATGDGLALRVTTSAIGRVKVEFTCTLERYNVESLYISWGQESMSTGFQYLIEAQYEPNAPMVEVTRGLSIGNDIEARLAKDTVRKLRLEVSKDYPDYKSLGTNYYVFHLRKLLFIRGSVVRDAQLVTSPVELPEGTAYVAIRTSEYVPEGASVNYEIAQITVPEVTANTYDGLTWRKLEPVNRMNYSEVFRRIDKTVELPPEYFAGVSKFKASATIRARTDKWRLIPDTSYRVPLYNILEGLTVSLSDKLEIRDGVIRVKDGFQDSIEIDWEATELYNGVGDYYISTEIEYRQEEVRSVPIIPVYNANREWFEQFSLLEPATVQIRIVQDTNSIVVSGVVTELYSVVIYDEAGRKLPLIAETVTVSGNSSQLTLNGMLLGGFTYSVQYTRKIRDTVEVEPRSLVLVHEGQVLREGIDYIYSEVAKRVTLVRSDVEYGIGKPIYMSYRKTERATEPRKVYKTWFRTDRRIVIEIYPFSVAEQARGNFHRIDGNDVSSITEYELLPGWHLIETTQPNPSVASIGGLPTEDVNSLTKAYSNAGINLGNAVTEVAGNTFMIAFREPMRRVPVSELESNVEPNNRKVYSIHNGKVMMNKQPSSIEPLALLVHSTAHEEGEYFRNKVYDWNSGNYTAMPEAYLLSVAYKDKGGTTRVALRVTMSSDGKLSPRVEELALIPVVEG